MKPNLLIVASLLCLVLLTLHITDDIVRGDYPEIAKSPGGFFFVWTLWALGGLGGLTTVLAAQGLWDLRRPR